MAEETLVQFLEEESRPFNLTGLQAALRRHDFTKQQIQKALDILVKAGRVKERNDGQKVYFIAQDTKVPLREVENQVKDLDRQIDKVNSKLLEANNKLKTKTALEEKPSLRQVEQKRAALEAQLRGLKNALKEFDGVVPVSPTDMKRAQEDYDKYLKLYRQRKRLCLDMLDALYENYPGTKKKLCEDIGIETDEDANFSLSNDQ